VVFLNCKDGMPIYPNKPGSGWNPLPVGYVIAPPTESPLPSLMNQLQRHFVTAKYIIGRYALVYQLPNDFLIFPNETTTCVGTFHSTKKYSLCTSTGEKIHANFSMSIRNSTLLQTRIFSKRNIFGQENYISIVAVLIIGVLVITVFIVVVIMRIKHH
jgi:hypothetical protein